MKEARTGPLGRVSGTQLISLLNGGAMTRVATRARCGTQSKWGWLHLSNDVKPVDAQEAARLHIDFLSECTSSANGVRTKVLGNFTPATAPVCAIPVSNTPVPS